VGIAPAAEGLWESNFGSRDAFALGVEEELLLVGADHELVDRGEQVVGAADPDAGEVSRELFRAMVEGRSEVSANAGEACAALREVRRELIDSGTGIVGAGLHPNASPGEAEIQQTPRYALIEDSLQGVLRTPICGQHVHVGMPDAETAVRAYNGIRTHVPLLNALASNSPFWFGEDSGLASARTVIFRSYPRAAMAPEFADFADFCTVTRQVCAAGGLEDYTHIWWDVRIHPALGTIEVRAADSQFDVRRVAALSALVHCLTRVEAERDQNRIPAREALAESSFQATRHGLDARLLDRECDVRPACELARESLEQASAVAGEFGCEEELAYVDVILEQGSGADLQRRVYARDGMPGLLAFLVSETARLE
jgi:glutamate---cysteine ligase / carboxylate-amine ligase